MVNAVKKVPVGAHYGWKDWLAQRVTAAIMLLFSIVIIGFFMLKGGVNYGEWKELFRSPVVRILALLFFLSVYYHAWIGQEHRSRSAPSRRAQPGVDQQHRDSEPSAAHPGC